jgi:iron complex transport system ATP-binding protein
MRLEASGVRIAFGSATILDSVDLAFEPGQFVGLIGPNGAGKSSLLRVLADLLSPERGNVRCGNRLLADIPAHERARLIAYLEQDGAVHWPVSVEQLVALGRLPHRRRRDGAGDELAIARALAATETETLRQRMFETLSGGEKRRALLARALAVEASILLTDEPVAALDPYHQLHIMEVLRATTRAGTAVVAVLHELTLAARFCDRLILIADRHVMADGPPDSVLTAENVGHVYHVSSVIGQHEGQRYLVPWDRH